MAVQRSAAERGGVVRLVDAQHQVRRVFELVGLKDVLTADEGETDPAPTSN